MIFGISDWIVIVTIIRIFDSYMIILTTLADDFIIFLLIHIVVFILVTFSQIIFEIFVNRFTIFILGNILTILTLVRSKMKDNLFSDYLVSMCLFNIIILIMSAIRMITLSITGSEFLFYTPRVCL